MLYYEITQDSIVKKNICLQHNVNIYSKYVFYSITLTIHYILIRDINLVNLYIL